MQIAFFKNIFKYKYYKDYIPKNYFEDMRTVLFYDMEFKVPKTAYLEYRYGENWRIPDKDYKLHRYDNVGI